MSKPSNPWKTLSSRVVHQSRYITLIEDDVITPTGKPGKYTYTTSPPFVLAVAYDGERFVLVRQYRYPLKRVMTEFPGGNIDENEEPLAAAKRELQEETGITANKWTKLGTINNPNLATVFLAEDLQETNSNKMGEDGIAEVVRLTWDEIEQLVTKDEFTDSKTMAALFLFEHMAGQ